MGGKDSPSPPCPSPKTTGSPLQSPKWGEPPVVRRNPLALRREPSPLVFVPRSVSEVQLALWNGSAAEKRSPAAPVAPEDYSPVRAYMDCLLAPRALKFVMVGDSGVGKTSMLMSYTVDKFPDEHTPTIYDKFSTSLTVNGRRVSVTLCDTAGQDDFAHLRPLCYPQADVAIICFSVVDQASFESAKTKWVKELERYCPGVPVVVIGTQTDMRENPIVLKELKAQGIRPITKSEGNKFAAHISAAYVECSALTQQNIKCAFDEAIATALELNTSSRKRTPHCHKPCTIL